MNIYAGALSSVLLNQPYEGELNLYTLCLANSSIISFIYIFHSHDYK
jgi:hypothetical protein